MIDTVLLIIIFLLSLVCTPLILVSLILVFIRPYKNRVLTKEGWKMDFREGVFIKDKREDDE